MTAKSSRYRPKTARRLPTAVETDQLLHLARMGIPLSTAARTTGVPASLLQTWLIEGDAASAPKALATFAAGFRKAQAAAETLHVAGVLKAAQSGDVSCHKWILERRWPHHWGARVQVTVEAELHRLLDTLERALPRDVYEQVTAALANEFIARDGGDGGSDATAAGE